MNKSIKCYNLPTGITWGFWDETWSNFLKGFKTIGDTDSALRSYLLHIDYGSDFEKPEGCEWINSDGFKEHEWQEMTFSSDKAHRPSKKTIEAKPKPSQTQNIVVPFGSNSQHWVISEDWLYANRKQWYEADTVDEGDSVTILHSLVERSAKLRDGTKFSRSNYGGASIYIFDPMVKTGDYELLVVVSGVRWKISTFKAIVTTDLEQGRKADKLNGLLQRAIELVNATPV